MNPSIVFYHVLHPLPGAEAFGYLPEGQREWWMSGKLPSVCEMTVEDLDRLAREAFIEYPLRWDYLKQHVLGGRLSPEFRRIARQIYLLHLRKYILGSAERFQPFRGAIRTVKSALGR
jgi:hypothetical protein